LEVDLNPTLQMFVFSKLRFFLGKKVFFSLLCFGPKEVNKDAANG
jgi:hypothetical protein